MNARKENAFTLSTKASLNIFHFIYRGLTYKTSLQSGDNLFQITINFAKIFSSKAHSPSTWLRKAQQQHGCGVKFMYKNYHNKLSSNLPIKFNGHCAVLDCECVTNYFSVLHSNETDMAIWTEDRFETTNQPTNRPSVSPTGTSKSLPSDRYLSLISLP